MRAWMVWGVLVLAGCSPAAGSLQVQLVTDYAPVRDFDTVSVTLDGVTLRATPAARDRSYGRAVRVALFEGLAAERASVSVALSLAGRTIQSQPRVVEVRAGSLSIVTVHITNDCENVHCPGLDAPTAIACLGGVCVDPTCSPENPASCPASCAPGCTGSPHVCVTRTCGGENVCIDLLDDGACMAGQICFADLGCQVPFSGPVDGGTGDASVDAALAADAGLGTLDQFFTGLASTICDVSSACFGSLAGSMTHADCTAQYALGVNATMLPRLMAAEAAGTFHFDGSFGAACLAATAATACESLVNGLPAVCENVLQGRVALGGACNDTLECVGDAYCAPDGDGVCPYGTCVARSSVGGPCPTYPTVTGDQHCAVGLRCVAGTCATAVALGTGGPCPTGSECNANEFCIGPVGSQHCASYAQEFGGTLGATCDPIRGPLCGSGLACAGTTCQPIAGSAGACMQATPEMCPSGAYCEPTTSLCTPLPTDGTTCADASHYPRCAGALGCGTDGVCHVLQTNGASCNSPDVCASHLCQANVCVAPTLCVLGP